MNINLNTCRSGQKLKLRNGDTGVFVCFNKYGYHEIKVVETGINFSLNANGKFRINKEECGIDVVEILPLDVDTTVYPVVYDLYIRSCGGNVYQLFQTDKDIFIWKTEGTVFVDKDFSSMAHAIKFALDNQAVLVVKKVTKEMKETVTYTKV